MMVCTLGSFAVAFFAGAIGSTAFVGAFALWFWRKRSAK